MPLFLFLATAITLGAFANEGGHKVVEEKGVKAAVGHMLDKGKADFKVNE